MLEKEIVIPNNNEENTKNDSEIVNEDEQLVELPQVENTTTSVKAEQVDKNDKNYQIHQGRIDCQDITKCMEMTLPIQLKYSHLISNVTYLEVMSNKHKVLGYYIEYTFKSYQFETYDICKNSLDEISKLLSDKIGSTKCSETGKLITKTNYEEGEYSETN